MCKCHILQKCGVYIVLSPQKCGECTGFSPQELRMLQNNSIFAA